MTAAGRTGDEACGGAECGLAKAVSAARPSRTACAVGDVWKGAVLTKPAPIGRGAGAGHDVELFTKCQAKSRVLSLKRYAGTILKYPTGGPCRKDHNNAEHTDERDPGLGKGLSAHIAMARCGTRATWRHLPTVRGQQCHDALLQAGGASEG